MKRNIEALLFSLLVMISMISCNKEELFVEPIVEVVKDDPVDDTNDIDGGEVDVNSPCDFTLDNVQPNSTIIINCILDLDGQTVNLPAGVTLDYEGGDIINGTINFSEGNIIDSEFLNSTLTIGGTKPQMKDPIFVFHPDRWGIVQGETTSQIALRNNEIFESTMFMAQELGLTTMKVDEIDAFFEVNLVTSTTSNQNYYPSREAINMPSNFTLSMTENTHLRVLPNDNNNYVLLSVLDETNVRIEGGNLYGDRPRHDDSKHSIASNSGHVVMIIGASNVEIDGVRIVDGTGDGIDIASIGFTFEAHFIPSQNIKITNCILDNNRRNNISITGGFNILVDGNTLLNAGVDRPNSPGVRPGYAIDVEALRGKDDNGEFIFWEKAYDITISNNIERGSKHGAFIVAIGEDTTISNNVTEGNIAIGAGSGVKIVKNKITAANEAVSSSGISTGHPDSTTNFNNVISGNTVKGYNIGIAAYTEGAEIFDNILLDFGIGIHPKNISDMNIYRNTFNSSNDTSMGIFGNLTSMNNINIYENEFINVGREAIKMVQVNNKAGQENNSVIINNNKLNGFTTTLSGSKGIDFTNNKSSENVSLVNSENMNISGNIINSNRNHGIEIGSGCKDISVSKNTISVEENKECIYQSSTGINIQIASDNICK